MQDPETGRLHPIDNPEDAKPGWPVYKVGDEVKFGGWYWRIESFTEEGGLRLQASRKVNKKHSATSADDQRALQRKLAELRKGHPATRR